MKSAETGAGVGFTVDPWRELGLELMLGAGDESQDSLWLIESTETRANVGSWRVGDTP
jgi:hypothetical protein